MKGTEHHLFLLCVISIITNYDISYFAKKWNFMFCSHLYVASKFAVDIIHVIVKTRLHHAGCRPQTYLNNNWQIIWTYLSWLLFLISWLPEFLWKLYIGSKDLPINCIFVPCNLHDSFLIGSRVTAVGDCGASHRWFSPLKLCFIRY